MNFCQEGGCVGIAVTGNFCPDHVDPINRRERNTPRHVNDAWYRLAAWRGVYGVRNHKIRRNPQCEICGKKAEQVHHLRPWKDAGDWFLFLGGIDMEFLQSLCRKCHSAITWRELMYGPDQKQGR